MDNQFWLKTWLNTWLGTWWNMGTWFHYVGNDASETLNNINSWQSDTKKQYYDTKNQEIANQAQNMFECSVRTDDWQVRKMNMSWANLNNMALLIKQASNQQWFHSYDELDPWAALCRFLQKNPKYFQLSQDTLNWTISLDDWAYETKLVNPLANINDISTWERQWTRFSSRRNLTYDPTKSTKSLLTPQNSEWNDNLLWYMDWTKWGDVETKYANSEYPYVEAFVDNFGKSFYNLVSDYSDIIANPLDTIWAVTETAVWAASNLLTLDDRLDSLPNSALKEFLKEANEYADWAWDYLVDRFRWRDEDGNLNNIVEWIVNLWDTFYTDPVWFLSDIFDAIEWWAWLTKWVLKKVKNLKNIDNIAGIEKWIETANKIQKTAWAASPSAAILHPIDTFNRVKNELKSLRDYSKNTRAWKQVLKYANKAKDYVFKSKKMDSFRKLADTKIWKYAFPEASEIYKNLAPMDPSKISKFESDFWIKYWDHLNEKWIKWTPQEIIDQLQFENDKLFKEVSDWFANIEQPLKVSWADKAYMESMLQHNIMHLKNTYPEKVFYTRPELQEMVNALIKLQDTWEISWMDYLFNKRYFERKTKFSYWKTKNIAPDRVELATNIDNAIRDIWLEYADKNWFKNMKNINDQIRKNRAIIDWMWEKAIKAAWYKNWIELSDVILAASSWDPSVLSTKALLGFLDSNTFKKLQLKLWNAIRWIKKWNFDSVDMNEIRKVNAKNRVEDFYNMAKWDWSPRLENITEWWVVATDNTDWATMRASDLPKLTDLVIEQYAKTPRDVEKKVVDWTPINTQVKWDINWEQRWQGSIFDTTLN